VTKQVQKLDHVIIRFAGDSGDGMQLTGDRFTQETAVFGNDLSTLPNFPAEIRAPAGTLPGVSSFQLHFADHDILTPGDAPDVLIAMNPAALKANIKDLPRGGDLIINTDEFTKRNLTKVGYQANPLEDGSLEQYHVHAVPLTSMTVKALEDFEITRKDAERAKNMFALGMLSWLYDRPADGTLGFLKATSARPPRRSRSGTRSSRRRSSRAPTGTSAATPPWPTGSSRRRSCRACRCSSAPTRSRRPPTSCTSWPSTSGSRSARSRQKTRSPPSARRSARRSAARWPSPAPQAPACC
jgi:Pyruvate/2-oxoacid:ferredoxin oxidoreductase gamma subunit